MSSSSEKVEVSGQRGMRTAEKPSGFTQTCSMLYQYLKEEGGFGDLNLDMVCNKMQQSNGGAPEMFLQKAPPMHFFPCMETSRNMPTAAREFKSMDFFPQQAGFGPSAPTPREEVPKMTDSSVKKSAPGEPQKAQMTIFYDGQVIVFNDFPADKAKEVMLIASKESSQRHTTPASTLANINNFASHLGKTPINSSSSVPPSTNMFPKYDNQAIQEGDKPSPRPIVCDLPLARKASLHRFLEKRKDRLNTRAPYQTSNPPSGPAKPTENKSWLGLAAQQTQ
uniref:Protein TIFY n=1 Tax=Eriobotrya japonica TaxID=32224 RepID=A0A6C0NCK4_9ROSA|nr:jasmonate zim-domain protein [Eriobotrya japonica]